MRATIRRYPGAGASLDEVLRVGRQLADALDRVPGFVTFVLLEASDGQLTTLSIGEHAHDLATVDDVARAWLCGPLGLTERQAADVVDAEVVIQRGL